jgi:thiol-disulfide isomerase/thioredoxin
MKKIFLFLAALALSAGLNTYAQSTNATQDELRALVQTVKTKIEAGKTSEADFTAELKQFDQLIAQENGARTDEAAQIVFMKAMLYIQVLDETDKGEELIKQIKTDYPDTKIGKRADSILASLDQGAAAKKIQDGLAVGSTFPDFAEKDLGGKPISVAGFKGKVVLVDFWATWCGPCRGELPNVIATYKKHHPDGFEIIGVSLDSDRDKLDAFLKQTDGMTWQQFFDGQGWSNKLAVKYGVQSIPFAVLIGPDGKIIGKSLRGEELEDAVAGALAKK